VSGKKRDALVLALLCCPSLKAAAKRAGVAYSTAKRWWGEPEFQAEYGRARRAALVRALGTLQGRCGKAVRALTQELTGARAGDRIRAATAVLDYAVQADAVIDLAGKVADLEAKVKKLVRDAKPQRKSRTPAG
jgi:hypothetical protein